MVGKMSTQDRSGFTLVELLVVIAIIAILAAIALPLLNTYRTRAVNATAESDIRNLKSVLEAYYYDHQQYP
jgi:prepilin-type N-terminal cleavage/methylation domain-containing protein